MAVFGLILAALFFGLILALFLALPVMWLWNWLMPVIFGLPEIGWLQAFGLMILCGFLFRSHGSVGTK